MQGAGGQEKHGEWPGGEQGRVRSGLLCDAGEAGLGHLVMGNHQICIFLIGKTPTNLHFRNVTLRTVLKIAEQGEDLCREEI